MECVYVTQKPADPVAFRGPLAFETFCRSVRISYSRRKDAKFSFEQKDHLFEATVQGDGWRDTIVAKEVIVATDGPCHL